MSEPLKQTQGRSVFYASLAVLIAGGTALGAWRVVKGYEDALEVARRPGETVEVLGAAHDIDAGAMLVDSDLQVVRVPRTEAPEASVFIDPAVVVGESTVERILAGEPIRRERLTLGDGAPPPQSVLEPGMRAVTVKVDRAAGVGGLVTPGSFVDVIVTIRPDANAMDANWVTETIIQAVRVLAVGDVTVRTSAEDRKKEDEKAHGTTSTRPRDVFATLEVEPEEAEKIAMATSRGDLYLSLRPKDDFDLVNADAPLVTNALVGISAKPSPTRAVRLERLKVAVAPRQVATPPVLTGTEIIAGPKVTVETFDAAGTRVVPQKKGR